MTMRKLVMRRIMKRTVLLAILETMYISFPPEAVKFINHGHNAYIPESQHRTVHDSTLINVLQLVDVNHNPAGLWTKLIYCSKHLN